MCGGGISAPLKREVLAPCEVDVGEILVHDRFLEGTSLLRLGAI